MCQNMHVNFPLQSSDNKYRSMIEILHAFQIQSLSSRLEISKPFDSITISLGIRDTIVSIRINSERSVSFRFAIVYKRDNLIGNDRVLNKPRDPPTGGPSIASRVHVISVLFH